MLSPAEFKWGIFEFGLQLSDTELAQLMKAFDTNGDGAIRYMDKRHRR
jgi:Ca2+-binding EF-hand superfamily protein